MDNDPTLTRRKAWRLAGNDAKVWRSVVAVSLTVLVTFVIGSTWAWMEATGDVAAENAFGALVGMGALVVFLPAFIVFEIGLIGLATTTKSRLERTGSWVVAAGALATLAAYIVDGLTI